MKLFSIILTIFISSAAFAESSDLYACLEQNDSTVGREDCQYQEFKSKDQHLSQVLDQHLMDLFKQKHAGKDVEFKSFFQSHRKFVAAREAICTKEVADMEGGTGQGFRKFECMTRLTQERIQEVEQKLHSPE